RTFLFLCNIVRSLLFYVFRFGSRKAHRQNMEKTLRIIGGSERGRSLKAPEGMHTRPTLDKVRGAVFNVLFDVTGLEVLDMFGGSGAMGFEALSRGAAKAVIIDADRAAFRTMELNKKNLNYGDRAQLRFSDFRKAFRRDERFDIIFLDPPYGKGLLEDALLLIDEKNLLKEDGIIVCETGNDMNISLPKAGPEIIKEKVYGKTKVLFMKY
ncbi:MAG: 16S rRNA (guanine(966)-N(2))-methyltransferase RsmD, partial [Christensenellaceae bacterium]|nr:16S rRNA (guanine(966)-N(2))-methyltransferase RsmD [Christensenellaceae bacterium]